MQEASTKKPKSTQAVVNDLHKAKEQFDEFDKSVKDMTMDRMNTAPKEEVEPQAKLSQSQIERSKDVYLKPKRKIPDGQKFNEAFRDEWNFQKEYVHIIAEHKELIGENIEMWTHPFGGVGAEYWEVPTNKPIWVPRYLAEQIKRKSYHRLVMQQNNASDVGGIGQMYGTMAADSTIQRLDARPVGTRKSIFMGANNF